MKYRLGYDYYWNFAELFRYKGKVVLGANINVLFSPIFECTEAKYKESEYYPEQQYQGAYLFEYFVPEFDSSNKTFIFTPTAKGKNIKGISFEIVGFELAVLGEPDMELESSLPPEFRGMTHLEPFTVTEEEFMDLFSIHKFTDLQSTAYFGKRVDSSELREQGQVKKKSRKRCILHFRRLCMLEIKGKYNTAKVFTDNIDAETISQIINLCNQQSMEKSKIRIMPDCHAGAGCTIGTTMTIEDKIVPNLIGVDIGCGMFAAKIDVNEIDFEKLDRTIRKNVPSGMSIHDAPMLPDVHYSFLNKITAPVDIEKAKRSIGTLGGGNHFIEVDKDTRGNYWLVIHTGSRHLGLEVARYYQELAYEDCKETYIGSYQVCSEEVIKKLKAENRHSEIEHALKNLKKEMETNVQSMKIPKELAYLSGQHMDNYLHDIAIVQDMASMNRFLICKSILDEMGWRMTESFQTIHNYIDVGYKILRKGSVSARNGERLIIPINMRDGVLLCKGKGNEDWNYSAPHGAGRVMSRGQAKERISMEEFHKSMTDIYTTSVCKSTLDEAPQAYKPMQEIMDNIQDTVEILDVWKPVYNFKAN